MATIWFVDSARALRTAQVTDGTYRGAGPDTTIWQPKFNFGDAPVDGVQASHTFNMTNANSDMTYTAVNYGTGGNSIGVTHVDPSGNDQALAVSVSGNDITISLATGVAGAITSTAAQVKAAVNAHPAASTLVTAEDESTGAGVVNAIAKANLAGGVVATAGAVGDTKVKADGTLLYIKVSAQTWKKVTLSTL